MKKVLCNVAVIAAALFICGQIGQYRLQRNSENDVPQKDDEQATEEISGQETDNEALLDIYDVLDGFVSSKDVQTDDNPWGVLVGVLESDDFGKFLLVTAGNDFSGDVALSKDTENLVFAYMIHPWVNNEKTDGAELVITVTSAEGETISQQYEIQPMAEEQYAEMDLSAFAGQTIRLRFEGFGGENGDLTNDWIILKNLEIKTDPR